MDNQSHPPEPSPLGGEHDSALQLREGYDLRSPRPFTLWQVETVLTSELPMSWDWQAEEQGDPFRPAWLARTAQALTDRILMGHG